MFTSIPKALRDKLGEQAAESLAQMLTEYGNHLEGSIINQSEYRFENALTQSSASLRQEMAEMRSELREEMAAMRSELREEMAAMRSELREEMADLKTELHTQIKSVETRLEVAIAKNNATIIRWMFIFWVGQIGAIMSILFLFFN